jgi:AraC-like DNA-binding protein
MVRRGDPPPGGEPVARGVNRGSGRGRSRICDSAHGWIAALRDPILAPALAALHEDPARRWTVAMLAGGAGASRSSLDDRFRQVLGQSPIRYLTAWRMHLAGDLLATTELSVFTIARRVGYDSEEAFSRAFKRERGVSPSQLRVR